MNYGIYFKKTFFLVILTICTSIFAFAQTNKTSIPRQDTLLNRLKVLIWTEPTAPKVTVKLRIHSGAMFDPKDKIGVMALLSDSFFPTDQAKAFFTEDLEGSLELSSNYDYIQITATGKPDEVLAMLETISNAVVSPQITAENFKLISESRLKKVREMEKNPSYIADRAVAKRLFGEFPYGRSAEGTTESLVKIDRADILLAKERFLTSDNATIAIIGNVKADYVFRATRQLFGGWTKADKKVPATFRQPDEPNITPQVIDSSKVDPSLTGNSEIRFATRGISRSDKDYFALRFLVDILQTRFRTKVSKDLQDGVSVVLERTLLPSLVSFKFSVRPSPNSAGIDSTALKPVDWIKEPITASEFEQAKAKILLEIEQKPLIDKTLDVHTFKLISVNDEMQKLNSVTLADVQRIAEKLSKQSFVQVTLGNSIANKP